MSGKRLLDAAALFNASQGVVIKHVAARRHQWNAYSRTSTLARALRDQRDRVNVTVRALSALAKRFNGPAAKYSTEVRRQERRGQDVSVPSQVTADQAAGSQRGKQGIEQDHFYQKSTENSAAEPAHAGNLDVMQERTQRKILPDGSVPPLGANNEQAQSDGHVSSGVPRRGASKDIQFGGLKQSTSDYKSQKASPEQSGTPSVNEERKAPHARTASQLQRQAEKQIPSHVAEHPPVESSTQPTTGSSEAGSNESGANQRQEVFYSQSPNTSEVLSALPRVKLPKATGAIQESDPHVSDERINQDVFYSSGQKNGETSVPEVQALPKQDGPSEDMYSELFHSPKVAKMLRAEPREYSSTKALDLPGASNTPVEETKPPQDKDQATFLSRMPEGEDSTDRMATATAKEVSEQSSLEEDSKQFAEELAQDVASRPASDEVRPWTEYKFDRFTDH